MFETPDLGDVAFLTYQGFRIISTSRRGSLVCFTLDIPAAEAERWLSSPERQLCAEYHRAWKHARRLVDRTRGVELAEGVR